MHRTDINEIRERTYKSRDAWWTVLLVDPIAVHLVRFVAPYRWITPNLLSTLAFVFGLGSAACFAMQDRWWLVAGALLATRGDFGSSAGAAPPRSTYWRTKANQEPITSSVGSWGWASLS